MADEQSVVDESKDDDAYEIRFEPAADRVRVEFNGTWVADSSNALVVYETRVPPMYYFPIDDVGMDYLEKTEHQTHCPFKGNASYWTLTVGEETAENAVWGYEDPYSDGEELRGYVSFYQSKVNAIYEGDEEVAFLDNQQTSMHANTLAGWLLEQAWKAPSADQLISEFCSYLHKNDYPISRMTVIIPTLHPQVFATVLVWREDDPEVKVILEPHDILLQPKFSDSPFAPIIKGAGGVRRRLEGDDPKLDYPVCVDLQAEGATDYAAMPFTFSDGQINVMSMTSFAEGGFSTSHLGQIYEILPMLGRLFEVHAQKRTSVTLLETYLGRRTGRRVLEGQIKHGDGELIHAIIWFCDFRDSTALSESMEQEIYLVHLNRFFHCMAGAIIENGGEVLRFIGDAVLAIFPIAGETSKSWENATGALEACRRAIKATEIISERIEEVSAEHGDLPPLKYGIGLHLGDVTYGNIGIPERLEFTVIGSAANEAARIEGMTKELQEPVLISSTFADTFPGKLKSVGQHTLKGLEGKHELFALPGD
jgi:adenylate cyclase